MRISTSWQARLAGAMLFGVGITVVMEELIDRSISPTIKEKMSAKIQDTLNDYLAIVPLTHRLYSLTIAPERVVYTVCRIE